MLDRHEVDSSILSRPTNHIIFMDFKYYVYVLYSKEHDRYYTGSSADPQKRVLSHNDPRNKGWTSRYAPWELIYTQKFDNKTDALKKEKWLKSGIGREFIQEFHSNKH